jgi:hypothetical protein
LPASATRASFTTSEMAAPMLVIVRMPVTTPTDEVASACKLISPHERSCSAPAKNMYIYQLIRKTASVLERKERWQRENLAIVLKSTILFTAFKTERAIYYPPSKLNLRSP